MSSRVLLILVKEFKLIKELGKRDKMRGLSIILSHEC